MGLRDRIRLLRDELSTAELLDRLADLHGGAPMAEQADAITIADGAASVTYDQARDLVNGLAQRLRPRCHGGRRMVVKGPNDYGFFLACLAVARAGGVFVPVNPRMRDEEIEYVVADADAEVVDLDDLAAVGSTSPRGPDGGEPEDPDDAAGIFYTSGTTGRPKGAVLSHRALLDEPVKGSLWPSRLRDDEVVMSLPIAHIMGFSSLLGAACAGIPVYFMPRFSPAAVLDAIEARRATAFIGVPAMYRMMLEAGAEDRDLSCVRLWVSAADVMPADIARRFKQMGATARLPFTGRTFGEATFAQGWGMVELGGAATAKISPPGTSWGLGDFLGLGLLGWRMRVVDDEGRDVGRGELGELLVKGPGVTRGYHDDPERTRELLTEEGWVRTGDLARKGRFGGVHFAGRKKDVLMHGGYSVYPAEIEEVLRSHAAVADAAVVGRPDPVKGEVPVAFVRLEPDAQATDAELVAWGREHLADYKAPTAVEFVEEFPRTGTGKIAKAELRERLT